MICIHWRNICFWEYSASIHFLWAQLLSFDNLRVLSQSTWWSLFHACPARADTSVFPKRTLAICSFFRVCITYVERITISPWNRIHYSRLFSLATGSFGEASGCLIVLKSFTQTLIPWPVKTLCSLSVTPSTYGKQASKPMFQFPSW